MVLLLSHDLCNSWIEASPDKPYPRILRKEWSFNYQTISSLNRRKIHSKALRAIPRCNNRLQTWQWTNSLKPVFYGLIYSRWVYVSSISTKIEKVLCRFKIVVVTIVCPIFPRKISLYDDVILSANPARCTRTSSLVPFLALAVSAFIVLFWADHLSLPIAHSCSHRPDGTYDFPRRQG